MRAYSKTVSTFLGCVSWAALTGCFSTAVTPPAPNSPCSSTDGCPHGYQCFPATTDASGMFCCKDKNSCGSAGSDGSIALDGAGGAGGVDTPTVDFGVDMSFGAGGSGGMATDTGVLPATDGAAATGGAIATGGITGTGGIGVGGSYAPTVDSGVDMPLATGGTIAAGGIASTGGMGVGGSGSGGQVTCSDTTKLCNGSCIPSTSCCGGCSGNTPVCSNNGTCVGRSIGDTCSIGQECVSTYCVDGVCCKVACDGQCQACNNTLGTCSRVTSGQPVGGRAACTNAGAACGGTCDGSSDTACRYPGTEQPCPGTATCSLDYSSTVTPACNGTGACTSSATSLCGASDYCSGGSCVMKGNGSCSSNIQCTSGNCSSNLCCGTGLTNSNGVCCTSGLTGCNGQCVNTSSNNTYCGSCTNSCTGNLTCSGSTCQCPNTSSACGSSCTACGSGQVCSAGSCACPGGAAFVCNACLSWDFESGVNSGWTLGSSSSGTGTLKMATSTGKGSYSLVIQNADFGNGDLYVETPLCNGAAVTIPSGGYTFSVDVLFQSTGYGFGYDGSNPDNCPAVVLEGDGGTAFSHIIVQQCEPFAINTWYNWSWTFPVPSTSSIQLRFSPGASWYGNIVLDNISIK